MCNVFRATGLDSTSYHDIPSNRSRHPPVIRTRTPRSNSRQYHFANPIPRHPVQAGGAGGMRNTRVVRSPIPPAGGRTCGRGQEKNARPPKQAKITTATTTARDRSTQASERASRNKTKNSQLGPSPTPVPTTGGMRRPEAGSRSRPGPRGWCDVIGMVTTG